MYRLVLRSEGGREGIKGNESLEHRSRQFSKFINLSIECPDKQKEENATVV